MAKKKSRWNKIRRNIIRGEDLFRYVGDGEGRFIFFRGSKQFSWEPIKVDRAEAKAFVDRMNGLTGTQIETIGRPLSNQFIKDARKAQFRNVNVFAGSAELAGRAEPGSQKEIKEHGTEATQNAGD